MSATTAEEKDTPTAELSMKPPSILEREIFCRRVAEMLGHSVDVLARVDMNQLTNLWLADVERIHTTLNERARGECGNDKLAECVVGAVATMVQISVLLGLESINALMSLQELRMRLTGAGLIGVASPW